MIKPTHVACSIACLLATGCATTSSESDPELERDLAQIKATEQAAKDFQEQQKDINRLLLNLDKTIDAYADAIAHSEYHRSNNRAELLAKTIHKWVDNQFDEVVIVAMRAEDPNNRARAVGALGFSKRREALDPLLNALRAKDDAVSNNAAFALAVLRDDRTPPAPFAAVIFDAERPSKVRASAAWALVQIQQSIAKPELVLPTWKQLLAPTAEQLDPWLITQAIRGIGLMRKEELAPVVEPYIGHPTPKVRMAAAIALGRLGNAASYEALLTRMGPSETVPNVRLSARKALQTLAGGIDREYDVKQWRQVFERTDQG